MEVRYSETACLLAQAGVGVTVVDLFSAMAQARHGGRLKIIPFKPAIEVEAFAVSAKNRVPSRLALLLVEEKRRNPSGASSRPDHCLAPPRGGSWCAYRRQ